MVFFVRTLDGVESVLNSKVVPGLVDPGDTLRVRFHVRGTDDRWLETNIWPADSPEPEDVVLAHLDKGAPTRLLEAGSVGLSFDVAADWASPPPTVSVDDLDVTTATK